ncbi:MAG: pyridoxal phosphate-dependent aminotransferase [Rhizobiales bacterium]|nr:pyridoxal phosphate-dependent aminotransferase [Hyphomicrobiales bacterium]
MPTFDSALLLAARASASDEGAIIRMSQKTRDLRAQGRDVVSLTLGEPDFDTPFFIQEAATAAMRAGFTHYSPVAGIPELRTAVAHKLKAENGLCYSPGQIVMANGVKQAIANAVFSLIEHGDEVILLAPFWVSYELTVKLAGGTPRTLSAGVEQDFKVSPRQVADALTPKSKLLILNSPNNPTGAVWTKAELQALADVVSQHPRLMVLSDEMYEYIIFEGEAISFGALPGMLERTITVNGFSKSFAMTGWRLGYAAAPEPIARSMARMQSAFTAGANSFVQRAAIAALEAPRDEVVRMRESYRRRRDIVARGLAEIPGVKMAPIPATFYAFPDVSAFLGRRREVGTVDALCDWLLETHGVTAVPGSAFGDDSCIRLSFAASERDIVMGLDRLKAGFAALS